MSSSSVVSSSTTTWPTHTRCDFNDRYGRPYWGVTTTIPIGSHDNHQQCFITCMNVKEGKSDGIWRPYLDTSTQNGNIILPNQVNGNIILPNQVNNSNTTTQNVILANHVIDSTQFITDYEQFLHAKVQRIQKEMLQVEIENTKLKIELQNIKDRLTCGHFSF